MNILVTGAKGFVGKNLCAALRNIRDGKDASHPELNIDEIFEYGHGDGGEALDAYCAGADFVFNLAGVNRPKDESEFMAGNLGFASELIETLKKHGNRCPLMLSSSIQAELDNPYGLSKRAGERLFFDYAKETGAPVYVYRFPNLFGKWCRPNYNSAVATFCYNMANALPIKVNDPSLIMTLAYIDDVVDELIRALSGNPTQDGAFCAVPVTHTVKLGEIAELLKKFKSQPETLLLPEIPAGSFEKKLYSTYLSYLPREKLSFPLKMNVDYRGSFTELLKTKNCGQLSVNISKPGITKGHHWHNTKWEFFIVVSGHGLIRERRLNSDEVIELEVSGEKLEAVHMLPGYTHSIENLSETEDMVTLMWANEPFDPAHPDTYSEEV